MSSTLTIPPAERRRAELSVTRLHAGRRSHPATVAGILERHAHERGDATAYTFLLDGERESESITFAQLHVRAAAVAEQMRARDLAGERAMILHPPGIDYLVAFFGCLYARVVAVPAYPPSSSRMLGRLRAIVTDAEPRIVLAGPGVKRVVLEGKEPLAALADIAWLCGDAGTPQQSFADPEAMAIEPEAIAFLQYTSGSTAEPRGVVLTHANLLHNQELIAHAFGHTAETRIVGWLPPYHDMGLIGNILQPLYLGAPCVLLAPGHVMQKPVRWLQAISTYRATTSGGPDFAFDLCCRRIGEADKQGLDLSSWRIAFNGAEPVRAATLERFTAAFAGVGFNRRAFFPCYGLAEASLIVSGGAPLQGPRLLRCDPDELGRGNVLETEKATARTLVACGRLLPDQDVGIVSETTGERLPDGVIGEIWVSGPSVAQGYWNRPQQSWETFAGTSSDAAGRRYLRTGDLGFLRDGELYVAGRIKDLIILRGRNYFPPDLEASVERSHTALRISGGAAFAVLDDGDESLVIVQELEFRQKPMFDEVMSAIRGALAREHELVPATIVLTKPGTLPKTSSGKIQRGRSRAMFGSGELPILARWDRSGKSLDNHLATAVASPSVTPSAPIPLEQWFIDTFAAIVKVDPATVDRLRAPTDYGLDSIGALEATHELQRRWGISVAPDVLFGANSIEQLITVIRSAGPSDGRDSPRFSATDSSAADFPLSYRQRGIWLAEQRYGSGGLALAKALLIQGILSTEQLTAKAEEALRRHPMLRMRLHVVGGEIRQRIEASTERQVIIHQQGDRTLHDLKSLLNAEAQRPFAAHGPFARIHIYPRGSDGHALLLTAHHLVADLWSFVLLLEEFFNPSTEPRTSEGSYIELVQTENQIVAQPDHPGERFWRKQLAGLPALEFPTHQRAEAAPRVAGGQKLVLDVRVTAGLRAVAARHGCTLYAVLLAAYQVLLFRYTRQRQIPVGCFASGRDRPEFASVVGCFVNPLVIVAECAGNEMFTTVLHRVRRALTNALRHQDFPFERLVESLRPGVDRAPFFNTVFSLQRAQPSAGVDWSAMIADDEGQSIERDGMLLTPVELAASGAGHDLALHAVEQVGTVILQAIYDQALLSANEMADFLRSYDRLLRSVATDDHQQIGAVNILTLEQRAALLDERKEEAPNPEQTAMLPDLFRARVAASPEAVALSQDGRNVTFAELGAMADTVTRTLRAELVGTGSLVGLLLERSVEAVAGMLGILSSGGVFVPIDPTLPRARISEIIQDSGAKSFVSLDRHRGLVPGGSVFVAVDMPEKPPIEGRRMVAPRRYDVAYVLYTSGSTGRPKGVVGTQHGIVNRLEWMWRTFPYEADEIGCLKTSLQFVDSICEILGPLLRGVPSVVLSDAVAKDPLALAEAVAQAGVTRLVLVPTVLQMLLSLPAAKVARLAGVRYWISSGEFLPSALLRRLQERFPDAICLNIYGSTEVAADVSCREATAADGRRNAHGVSVGCAIDNTRLYVLDPDTAICPAGAEGELYVSGIGLADGYLNRPELTAERFVPDPFRRGERMFRSGDRARKSRGGAIDVLGRMDRQVKINGQRAELGEIEAVAQRCAGVTHAAVTYDANGEGGADLALYVECQGDPDVNAWRAELGSKLPAYMVPAHFYRLARMPLTVSGKVDRSQLDPAAATRLVGAILPPANPLEATLVALWREVLGRDDVSIDANFFHLGGASLGAARLAARIEETTGKTTKLADIFHQPSVRQMAIALAGAPLDDDLQLHHGKDEGAVPATAAQRQIFIHQALDPSSTAYNMPGLFVCRENVDIDRMVAAAQRVVERQSALRTAFRLIGAQLTQEVMAAELIVPVIDAPADGLEEIRRSFVRPFDLSKPPLLRFQIVRQHQALVLCFDLHHIAADAESVRVFLRDFSAAYAGQVLAPLRRPFTDHARIEFAREGGAARRQAVRWWQDYLGSVNPAPVLSSATGATGWPTAAEVMVEIAADDAARLQTAVSGSEATLFMALLAAWGLVLHTYSGRTAFVIGTNMSRRQAVDDQQVMGVFINPVPLRVDIPEDGLVTHVLTAVRKSCLPAYERADVPYESLCDALGARETHGFGSLFESKLQLTPRLVPEIEIDGRHLEYVPGATARARTTLQLNVEHESEGQLRIQFDYDASRLNADQVREYAAAFETAIGVIGRSGATVADCRNAITQVSRQHRAARAERHHRTLHAKLVLNHAFSK